MKEAPSTPFSGSATLNGGTDEDVIDSSDSTSNMSAWNASDSEDISEEEFLERKIRAADSKNERIYETARWVRKFCNVEASEDGKIYTFDEKTGVWRGGDEGGKQRLRELLYETLKENYNASVRRSVTEQLKAQGRTKFNTFGTPEATVAVENGLLDLETGDLADLRPEHRALWQMPVTYEFNADCPRFRSALRQWIPDESKRKTLQEFVGYALDDSNANFEKILLLLGPTDTGKTVFLNVIETLFGKENAASQSIQYLANQRWGVDNIVGQPINIRHDLNTSVIKRTGTVKELASGNPMKAEAKHGDPYKIEPTGKHFFSANQVPQRNSPDNAFYNRWLTIIFDQQIPREEQDPKMLDKLTTPTELSGILNWAIEGYQRLHEREEFTDARSAEETRELWRSHGDSIDQFIVDWVLQKSDSEVEKSKVYDEYETYAKAQGLPVSSKQQVTSRLRRLEGVKQTQVRRGERKPRVFRGMALVGSSESNDK